jgi:hypothetical protein
VPARLQTVCERALVHNLVHNSVHEIVSAKPEPAYQELLGRPIRELGLTLAGSPVERFVEQLYRELDAKGLTRFRPACYLTDEWGCPSGEPIIGIPFYLAHSALAQLEKETHDLEDAREIMMYLRHEAGHAFTYSGRSGVLIATTIVPRRSLATMCGICRDGMRRSIRMKILPRPLRCG